MKKLLLILGGVLILAALVIANAFIAMLAINLLILPIIAAMTGVKLVAITLVQSFALIVALTVFKGYTSSESKGAKIDAETLVAICVKYIIYILVGLAIIVITSLFV
ncbi:hypothetical protein [Listeria booriae]|uniref:hypothetical protein n=1 Tax=Listeria booriae TaxID=1552123 RepID=UPI001625B65C|nr:hypothetical protein [Listeria booriae]MBC2188729.1 hypothetical protein [Listeria booriae]